MPRLATVRSASLAPDEIELVDRLAEQLAGGSFTELIRRLLRVFGEPLGRRLDELAEAGMDPHEQLVLLTPSLAATDAEIEAFYMASGWPANAPARRRVTEAHTSNGDDSATPKADPHSVEPSLLP